MKTYMSYIENMSQVNRDLRESICVRLYWHEIPNAILCLMCSVHLTDTVKHFLPLTEKKQSYFIIFVDFWALQSKKNIRCCSHPVIYV